MDKIWRALEGVNPGGTPFSLESIILSLMLAFVLSQALAWVYYITHSGMSYSKTFVQSLILISVVVAMVMTVIGNNIITAVGLMGALAIIRFRNIVKDTRDIAFIFCALVVGMAAGSQRYATAVVGTMILGLITLYLHYADFGSHEPHNGFLQFSFNGHIGPEHPIPAILKRFCSSFTLISRRETNLGGPVNYAYQMMIRNVSKNQLLLSELEKVEGVGNLNLTVQEQLLEI